MVKDYDKEAQIIKKELTRIVWYMRGGINLDQAYMLSREDTKHIASIIEENIKTVNKTGLPIL